MQFSLLSAANRDFFGLIPTIDRLKGGAAVKGLQAFEQFQFFRELENAQVGGDF